MRLVKIDAPASLLEGIRSVAFDAGVKSVSVWSSERHKPESGAESIVSIDFQSSTPTAKRFVRDLLATPFFDREKISVAVRQPRAILSAMDLRELTIPLEEPGTDLLEELHQFTHITYGLIVRVLIAGVLLGYGLVGQHILIIIAGLLFLPLLPMLLAMGFVAAGGRWRLALHGLAAFVVAIAVIAAGSALAALLSEPPLRYDEFPSFAVSLAISAIVGVAANLAAIDDTGRRELVGLAAAAQVGIFPAWLGARLVFGPSPTSDEGEILRLAGNLAANSAAIVLASLAVQLITGLASHVRRIRPQP